MSNRGNQVWTDAENDGRGRIGGMGEGGSRDRISRPENLGFRQAGAGKTETVFFKIVLCRKAG